MIYVSTWLFLRKVIHHVDKISALVVHLSPEKVATTLHTKSLSDLSSWKEGLSQGKYLKSREECIELCDLFSQWKAVAVIVLLGSEY